MMEEEDEDILFDQADIETGDDRTALLADVHYHGQSMPELHKTAASGPTKCFKIFCTITLCAAFLGLGLCIAIPGPTLLDLQQQTSTDTETISRIFTGRSIGYLFGSILSGVLFDKLNQPCLLSFSLLLTAAGTAVAPWCNKFIELAVVFAFQGLSMGFLDTGGNVMCVQTWGEGNGPWMQALHFSFGIGAFVAPLIAEPFLSKNVTEVYFINENLTTTGNFSLPEAVLNSKPLQKRRVRDTRYYDDGHKIQMDDVLNLEKNNKQKRSPADKVKSKSKTKMAKYSRQNKKNTWWMLGLKNPIDALGLADAFTGRFIEALKNLRQKSIAAPSPEEGSEVTIRPTTSRPTTNGPPGDTRSRKRPRPNNKGVIPNNLLPGSEGRSRVATSQIISSSISTTVHNVTEFNPSTVAVSERNTSLTTIEKVLSTKKSVLRPRPKKGRFGLLPSNFGIKSVKGRKRPTNQNNKKQPKPLNKVSDKSVGKTKPLNKDENSVIKTGMKESVDKRNKVLPSENVNQQKKELFGKAQNKSVSFVPTEEMKGSEIITTEELQKNVLTTRNRPNRPRPNNSRRLPNGFIPGGQNPRSRSKRNVESSGNSTAFDGSTNSTSPSTSIAPTPPKRKKPAIAGKHLNPDKGVAGGLKTKQLQHIKNVETEDKTTKKLTEQDIQVTPSLQILNNNTKIDNNTHKLNDTVDDSSVTIKGITTSPKSTTPTAAITTTTVSTTTTIPRSTSTSTIKTSIAIDKTSTSPSLIQNTSETSETGKPKINSDTSVNGSTLHDNINEENTLTKVKNVVNNAVQQFDIIIHQLTMVQFAYLTIAAYLFVVGFMFVILCCKGGFTMRSLKLASSSNVKNMMKNESKGFKVQLLILLFFFFFLYVGMEITYGGLLSVFCVKQLNWSKAQGSFITSVFFGSFATARGLTIFLAKCLSPAVILIVDLILTNFSLIAMLITLESNPTMIWYCNVILGLGMSTIFPTGVSWAEQYISLTGKDTACFVVGSAFGEMLLPAFTGFMFEQKSPMCLLYILTACAVLSIVLYILMQNLASNSGRKYSKISAKLRDTTLTDLDHADLEMESIPLTPDLKGDEEPLIGDTHTSGGYYEQNGTVGKSRKKVTFNFGGKTTSNGGGDASIKTKVKGSILKMKSNMKKD